MLNLHQLVESELEAPALAWNILAYYWGMSAFGLGPAYMDYMRSDQPAIDDAFNDALNDELNRVAGFDRRITIKERFDRAVNFYVYCYEQGVRYSINPPFDMPPDVDDLVQSRIRMESKAPPPDKLIQASNTSLLGDRPDLLQLWAVGGEEKRERRAQEYNARVLDTLNYVASEIKSRTQLSNDQLSETGFLVEDMRGKQYNVTAQLMDETMPEEVQDAKFGTCYVQRLLVGSEIQNKLVLSGIFGAYYTMGHNLELAMYNDENKARLSSTYFATVKTWRQLYNLSKEKD